MPAIRSAPKIALLMRVNDEAIRLISAFVFGSLGKAGAIISTTFDVIENNRLQGASYRQVRTVVSTLICRTVPLDVLEV